MPAAGLALWSVALWSVALWSVALCAVVAFEKINWSPGPTPSGYVHRCASIVAFLALPVAVLALGRRWARTPAGRGFAGASVALGVLSLTEGTAVVVFGFRVWTRVPGPRPRPDNGRARRLFPRSASGS